VAGVAAVPNPTASISYTISPAVVAATAAVPAPVLITSVTPAVVSAVAGVPPPDLLAPSFVTPNTVAATADVPAPSVGVITSVEPAVVEAKAAVPSVMFGNTVTGPLTPAVSGVPTPSITTSATATPAVVGCSAGFPAFQGSATVTAIVVIARAGVPNPEIDVLSSSVGGGGLDFELLDMLDADLQFRPLLSQGAEGQAVYGPLTQQVKGRFNWTYDDRTVSPRKESISNRGKIYVNAPDFDPADVPVGSYVLLPDGRESRISTIDPFYDVDEDETTDEILSHYRLSFG
jgi:hypothetical protein